ncbi:hypothetical protein ACIG5E_29435 [Kitasatospora sp. NPDC053057]|uniref:hypothetical protein n=1 Tax=Kitasatospora sp. NPDC053057 TaxID=3364062 RepID=UPI0037C6CCD2
MLVAGFDVSGRAADFDPATGRLGPERTVDSGRMTHGHYGQLAGARVVFYRGADGLRIRVGERDTRLDAATAVCHQVVGRQCVLTVGQVTELRYPVPPEWSGLENDLTPFVDAEDFDLGLFVANVLADRDRAARSYR